MMKNTNIGNLINSAVASGAILMASSTLNADVIHRVELKFGSIESDLMEEYDWTTGESLTIDEALFGGSYQVYVDDWNFKVGIETMGESSSDFVNDGYYGAPFANERLINENIECQTGNHFFCSTHLSSRKINQNIMSLAVGYAFTDAWSLTLEYQHIANSYESGSTTTSSNSSSSTSSDNELIVNTEHKVNASVLRLKPAYSMDLTTDLTLIAFIGIQYGKAGSTADYTGAFNATNVGGSLAKLDGSIYGMLFGAKVNYFASDNWVTSLSYTQEGTDYNLSDKEAFDTESTIISGSISYIF